MGVLLQGFYKMQPNLAVPSPADGDAAIPWWWDHIAAQAADLRAAGFTAVWLPPVLKTSAGSKSGADGYGPFDDYDLGSKNQMGSVPTRFGDREQLQRCVATLRADGLDVYLDMVEHHRSGDPGNFVFRYPGADGTPGIGRFPKDPLNFRPNVPQDPHLGGPPRDDFPFGRELCPINAKPPRYVFDNLLAAGDWLTRALDVQGYRIDDVKGLSTDFLLPFLNSRAMARKFAVGEFFDGNPFLVNGWIFNPHGMQGRPSAFDFPLRFTLAAMCANPGRFNMADLDHAGLAGMSPANAVTFVENHDTDLNSERIVDNKLLAYAYILTSEGYPCVYYRDYSTDRNCYGLKMQLDNLIWIHEKLAAGGTLQRWKDFDVFAYERLGAPNLLVGLNNDPDNPRTIRVATGFGAGTALHDYTGHSGDVTTAPDGSVSITIPRNQNGLGYVSYSRAGVGGGFQPTPHAVTQEFEGAADLDLPPASSGKAVKVSRLWCAANAPVHVSLEMDETNWTPATTVTVEMLDPSGALLASRVFARGSLPVTSLLATPKEAGFHTLRLQASNLPRSTAPFALSATYTAPRKLTQAAMPAAGQPGVAQAAADPATNGQWSRLIDLPNVPIHAHVLPTGKVLFWGRRQTPGSTVFATLNEHLCAPFIFDPGTQKSHPTKTQPALADAIGVNLFCSGHAFLPDGRLLVIGGHLFDSQGTNQACIYDPFKDSWTPTQTMNNGRWYPTAVTLPDGSVLACSGSFPTGPLQPPPNASQTNTVQQVWRNGAWEPLVNFIGLPLFPRLHVAPDGRVFMCGGNAESFFLDVHNGGTWTPGPSRAAGNRDYAPSVMYDVGKVIFIGGGQETDTLAPTNVVEIIDINSATPEWHQTSPMHFPRRQHNATLLPDGAVLVTGGTQGVGFDNLNRGEPVHVAELWNPVTGQWTKMADEQEDRCYHSTAVLLPDGRVLSAGGGEYAPAVNTPNAAKDSHSNAQIFSPPYLFKGARPSITAAPATVMYGQTFDVETPQAGDIGSVSWVRLPSVTHSFDQNQRINFLSFKVNAGKLSVNAPPNANVCPPGHYMLFVLNRSGVPSVARIIQISAPVAHAAAAIQHEGAIPAARPARQPAPVALPNRRPVVVGVTATCPYGISACWGGAYHALTRMHGVAAVKETPNADDSTADVYLKHDGLPDVELWPQEFVKTANGTHHFRGVEVTLQGPVIVAQGGLKLAGNDVRPPVTLAPIHAGDKIQWDFMTRALKPLQPAEQSAYQELASQANKAAGGHQLPLTATVTGPLLKTPAGFVLEVREFKTGSS